MAKKTSGAGKIAAGVGLAALAAAAAGAYYFNGPDGKKHKKQVKAWSEKAKKEMIAKVKQMKSMSAGAYHQAAAEVLAKYKQAKNVDPAELAALGKELKSHWDGISKTLAKAAQKAGKVVTRKPAKKAKKK